MSHPDISMRDAKSDVDGAVYKTLLESTKAIPWKIDWATMRFAYIGPQIEALLGWSQSSWETVQDWADRIHADDRQGVVDYCVAQSKAGIDHEADYRALTKDGSYVWLRDVVHVVRTADGAVDALVGFMFDISERKHSEERVRALEAELEQLSFKDPLTSLPNRRWLETALEAEWTIALRTQTALSLVMIEIDAFSQYAEHHGRDEADACVRKVGDLLKAGVTRPRDFFARCDDAVFVIVLPETAPAGVAGVAERCRNLLAAAGIPHGSATSGRVALRSSVGTIIPSTSEDPRVFAEAVRARLRISP